jgi:hypothetical protein
MAAIEVMLNSPLISDLIFKGEVHEIKEVMKNRELGMQTFDQALFDLYEAGKITYEDALRNADSLNDLRLQIKLHGKESKDRDLTTASATSISFEFKGDIHASSVEASICLVFLLTAALAQAGALDAISSGDASAVSRGAGEGRRLRCFLARQEWRVSRERQGEDQTAQPAGQGRVSAAHVWHGQAGRSGG